VAELVDHEFGRIGVDDLIDRCHHPQAHQRLDDVGAALGHAARQLLDGDRFGDDDLAHDFDRLLFALVLALALALARPADRGEAPHPLAFILGQRAGDGNLAAAAADLVAARYRHRPSRLGSGAAARRHRLFLLLGRHRDLACCGKRGDLCRRRLARPLGHLASRLFFPATLRLLLGALSGFLLGLPARLLFLGFSARFFLRLATDLLGDAFLLLTPAVRLGECRAPARLVVGLASILEGANAAGPFLRRQRPGDHDGASRRLDRRRSC